MARFKKIHKLYKESIKAADAWDAVLEQATIVFHATFTHQRNIGKDYIDARLIAQEIKESYLDWPSNREIWQTYQDLRSLLEAHKHYEAYFDWRIARQSKRLLKMTITLD